MQIPTVGFLYVAGYIGYVGRNYLNAAKKEKNPYDKEIIIDVPLAIKMSIQGAAWPLAVVNVSGLPSSVSLTQISNDSLCWPERELERIANE